MKSFLLPIMLFALCTHAAQAQPDWPMLGHDKARSSWASEETNLKPPFSNRVIQLPEPFASTSNVWIGYIASYDGILYPGFEINRQPNTIIALDPKKGRSLWTYQIAGSGGSIGNCPAISGDIVVVGGQRTDALLSGLKRSDGTALWTSSRGSMYGRSAVVEDTRAYLRTDSLYCIDIRDGQVMWKHAMFKTNDAGSPVIDKNNVYIYSNDTLIAFDKSVGGIKWLSTGVSRHALAVDDQHVYVSTVGAILALDPTDGSEVWTHELIGSSRLPTINGSPFAVNDSYLVYIIERNKNGLGTISVIDKTTGIEEWTHEFPGQTVLAPTIANGIVYTIQWSNFSLRGFDIKTGKNVLNDSSETFRSQPIIANGNMYVAAMNPDTVGMRIIELSNSSSGVDEAGIARSVILECYPNPFSGSTNVVYRLPSHATVRLELCDMLGRSIAVLDEGMKGPGEYNVPVKLGQGIPDVAAGTYLIALRINNQPVLHRISYLR
jgi:outer membrane protein assembly factor BamB